MSGPSAFTEEEVIESQISTIQLLQAMYPLPSELVLTSRTEQYLDDPDSSNEGGGTRPESLEAELNIRIDEDRDEEVTLVITLPLPQSQTREMVVIHPRQPGFVSRSAYESLLSSIPRLPSSLSPSHAQGAGDEDGDTSEYILSTIEFVKAYLHPYLPCSSGSTPAREVEEIWSGPEERVWYWFPSLSTRDKRDDLVHFAREVGLTGFVLAVLEMHYPADETTLRYAGKPGLLCVEGQGSVIDRYMARIKSESWSDIPPFQKKVTERLRHPLPSPAARVFKQMDEITHLIPKYGQYAHRGDMSEVRKLMESWGVGDDFGAVVLNNS